VRAAVAAARVARLGTVNDRGGVDLVPITFATLGEHVLVTAVDHKPKSTTALRRLDNIRARPEVAVLVDHYEEDWIRLWWVRLRGLGTVVEAGPQHDAAVDALVAKYPQYRGRRPAGAVIVIRVTQRLFWGA
jgi:PPOX class probable F420-dependent enzyme